MDVESKLALIRQLREEQRFNYQQIDNRAQILYGNNYRSSYSDSYGNNYGDYTHAGLQDELIASNSFSSFKLRLLLAILMFVMFFFMDVRNITIGEWDSQSIDTQISESISLQDMAGSSF